MILQTNYAHSAETLVGALHERSTATAEDPAGHDAEAIDEEWDPSVTTETDLQAILDQYIDVSEDPDPHRRTSDSACSKFSCPVFANVVKNKQRLYLYLNGELKYIWAVSTGVLGRETIPFDGNPNGRIYTTYSSKKYPGGSYKGLGNMPFAVFLTGGYAIHGTPPKNWSKLGEKASHGCVRLHPDNAQIFNSLVRQNKVANVWVSITDQLVQNENNSVRLGVL